MHKEEPLYHCTIHSAVSLATSYCACLQPIARSFVEHLPSLSSFPSVPSRPGRFVGQCSFCSCLSTAQELTRLQVTGLLLVSFSYLCDSGMHFALFSFPASLSLILILPLTSLAFPLPTSFLGWLCRTVVRSSLFFCLFSSFTLIAFFFFLSGNPWCFVVSFYAC